MRRASQCHRLQMKQSPLLMALVEDLTHLNARGRQLLQGLERGKEHLVNSFHDSSKA